MDQHNPAIKDMAADASCAREERNPDLDCQCRRFEAIGTHIAHSHYHTNE
jgi:hypothetical protein